MNFNPEASIKMARPNSGLGNPEELVGAECWGASFSQFNPGCTPFRRSLKTSAISPKDFSKILSQPSVKLNLQNLKEKASRFSGTHKPSRSFCFGGGNNGITTQRPDQGSAARTASPMGPVGEAAGEVVGKGWWISWGDVCQWKMVN